MRVLKSLFGNLPTADPTAQADAIRPLPVDMAAVRHELSDAAATERRKQALIGVMDELKAERARGNLPAGAVGLGRRSRATSGRDCPA